MSLHTVFVAVTCDSKYSAADVKQELDFGISFVSSELFDTLTGIYAAHIKPQVQTFTVWTSAKAEGCDTYEELVKHEFDTGYSYSSVVTTDNIDGIVDAVLNELDSDLLYHLISEPA